MSYSVHVFESDQETERGPHVTKSVEQVFQQLSSDQLTTVAHCSL